MAQAPHFHQIVWDFVLHDHGILLRIFHWQFGKLWCLQHYWWNLEKKYLMRSLYFVDGQLAKLKCRPFLGLANPLFINTVFQQIVSAETILFWKLECGNYSKEETIQGRKLLIYYFLVCIHSIDLSSSKSNPPWFDDFFFQTPKRDRKLLQPEVIVTGS